MQTSTRPRLVKKIKKFFKKAQKKGGGKRGFVPITKVYAKKSGCTSVLTYNYCLCLCPGYKTGSPERFPFGNLQSGPDKQSLFSFSLFGKFNILPDRRRNP